GVDEPSAMTEIQDVMWRDVGLIRNADGLRDAVARLDAAYAAAARRVAARAADPMAWREHNLTLVAPPIARAALPREESRGGHYRADFPARDDERWRIHIVESTLNLQPSSLKVSDHRS